MARIIIAFLFVTFWGIICFVQVMAAMRVNEDAKKRRKLALDLPVVVWTIWALVLPALGPLTYWLMNCSSSNKPN
ncbi:MAG: hypothetical protein M0Q40_09600 [Limnochordia bacterium]|jgi:polyferredoxin|nr:hypothetical protein [Limnochordia bacterium]MDD4519195.1 hypothetical protein [Limnochordia bacterium]